MNATVSYTEISDWTGKRFHITPVLKRVDEKSLEVSFKPGRFIPTVKVTFKVEAMSSAEHWNIFRTRCPTALRSSRMTSASMSTLTG